jgi:hypothetical protein
MRWRCKTAPLHVLSKVGEPSQFLFSVVRFVDTELDVTCIAIYKLYVNRTAIHR